MPSKNGITKKKKKVTPRPMGPSARRISIDPHIQRARRVPVDPHLQRAARKRQHPEVLSKSGYRTAPLKMQKLENTMLKRHQAQLQAFDAWMAEVKKKAALKKGKPKRGSNAK